MFRKQTYTYVDCWGHLWSSGERQTLVPTPAWLYDTYRIHHKAQQTVTVFHSCANYGTLISQIHVWTNLIHEKQQVSLAYSETKHIECTTPHLSSISCASRRRRNDVSSVHHISIRVAIISRVTTPDHTSIAMNISRLWRMRDHFWVDSSTTATTQLGTSDRGSVTT